MKKTVFTRDFEGGWVDLSDRLQQPDDFKLEVWPVGQEALLPNHLGVRPIITGTIEATHKICGKNLPEENCVGGALPTILSGNACFKLQAVNMISVTTLETTFPQVGPCQVSWPIQCHYQEPDVYNKVPPLEEEDVYVQLYLNGVLADGFSFPILPDREWVELFGVADGPVTAKLLFQTSYKNRRDIFTDLVICEYDTTQMSLDERIWNATVTEQIENGLRLNPEAALGKAIRNSGRTVVINEIDVEGFVAQAGEDEFGVKPRKVYVWNPTDGQVRSFIKPSTREEGE